MNKIIVASYPVHDFWSYYQCSDLDEDCSDKDHNHLKCWLYDPTKGVCPFLKNKEQG